MNWLLLAALVIFLVVWFTTRDSSPQVSRKYSTHIVSHDVLLGDNDHPLLEARHVALPTVPPASMQLMPTTITIDDQGSFGSCTGHAARYAWQLMMFRAQIAMGKSTYTPTLSRGPSRAFLYGEARLRDAQNMYGTLSAARIKQTLTDDSGASMSAVVWAMQNSGELAEVSYPYTSTNVIGGTRGNIAAAAPYKFPLYPAAPKQTAPVQITYGGTPTSRTATLAVMINALATRHPIVLGISVYQSFESAAALSTGNIPMPGGARDRLLGGHAICLSGYDTTTRRFFFPNSWGTSYGNRGMFTIPFDYVSNWNYAFDAWII